MKAVKRIEDFPLTDRQQLEDLHYRPRGNQLCMEGGGELYVDSTSQKRTFHNQNKHGFIVARENLY